jgi:hypothetical protein
MAKTSKADEYRTGAVRCELRAKKARTQDAREWQMTLGCAYRMIAEAEAERSALVGREIRTNKAAA